MHEIVARPLPQWLDSSRHATSKDLKPTYAERHPLFDWLHANATGAWEIVAVIDVPRYRWRPMGTNDGRFYRPSITEWGIAFDRDEDRLLYRMKWT